MLTPISKIFVACVVLSALPVLMGCGSVRRTEGGGSSLESAVSCYIDGDMDSAEALFTEVVRRPASDEDLQTAYLYLGRIYMARGESHRAAEAFSSGKLIGGDIRFDEYFELASARAGISATRVAGAETVTRAQLAALIHKMFGGALAADRRAVVDTAGAGEAGRDAAEPYFDAAVEAGVMRLLPDGRFHGDEKVTRPAFFLTASRVADALGVAPGARRGMFAGGYRGTLGSGGMEAAGTGDGVYVSGREVVDGLERIAGAAGL
ncbi:MAG: S-layer homology domain-containing protein [bacterium]